MFYNFQNRLLLQGTLTATTALRISAGRNADATTVDLPLLKDSLGKPFIPGSSFKGVLRSRIESLLRTLAPSDQLLRWACNPLDDTERCIQPGKQRTGQVWSAYTLADPVGIEDLQAEAAVRAEHAKAQAEKQKQQQYRRKDDFLCELVKEHTCFACGLFGSPWLAAHVQVRDWQVDEQFWFDQFLVRDGVAIDRDTETASDQKLYSYEVIPAGTRFTGTLIAENMAAWQLGLLLVGLREFEYGLALGGATSRGLGSIKLTWAEHSRYVDQQHLWAYLEDATTAGEPYQSQTAAWQQAMLTELKQRRNSQEEAHA